MTIQPYLLTNHIHNNNHQYIYQKKISQLPLVH